MKAPRTSRSFATALAATVAAGFLVPAGKAAAQAIVAAAVATAAPAVSWFDKAQVDAAFARGAVLFDGQGRNYMVHASRRDRAGMAEVHELDTDIIHVLGGAATFVTGGTVDDPREVEPNEIRGPSIRGGDSRRLAAGDVVIVPGGTPHWFRQVDGVLTYYVVKVR